MDLAISVVSTADSDLYIRTDKQTVDAVDLCNLLDILYTLNTLNLNNNHKVLVRSLDIASIGSLERVGSEHRSETSSTGRWVLGVADNLLCVLLDRSVSLYRGTDEWRRKETYDRVTHGCHDSVSSLVKGSLDHPFLGVGDSDDRADS
jgi:hypothetical protein